MATRWWVNDDADNDWEAANNWSATEGGAGGAGIPQAGDDVYFSDTSSSDACNLSANAAFATFGTTVAVTGGTDAWSGTFDGVTFDVACSGDFSCDAGNLDLGTGTWTMAGDWDTDGLSSLTQGTSTVVLSGTSKDLRAILNDRFYNLTVSGTVTLYDSIQIDAALTIPGTLSVNTGLTLILRFGSTNDFTGGTIQKAAGTPTLILVNGAGALSAAGTVDINVRIEANATIPARTFGENLEYRGASASNRTATIAAGTLAITGNLTLNANLAGDAIFDASANNPAVDIDGDIDFIGAGAGTEILQAGSGNWNVAGDVDLTSGTLTPGTSEFILDGSAAQTLTSDSESFYDLTHSNTAGSPGVTFVDALNVTNVFKCNTAAAKVMTFTDSVAYVMDTIDLAGASGQLILLRPSAGANAYTWNVTTNTQCDYVDVSWCDATPGIDIAATNSNDGGDTTAWTFGGVSVTVTPSAIAMTGALGGPVPAVTQIPAAIGMTGGLETPVPEVKQAPGAIGLTGGLGTPVPAVTQLPAAIGGTLAPQAPTPEVRKLLSALALAGALPAPTPEVRVLLSEIGITAALQTPTIIAGIVVEIAAALGITVAPQTPVPAVSVEMAALLLTLAQGSPTISTGAILAALLEILEEEDLYA